MTEPREEQTVGHTHQGAEPGRIGGREAKQAHGSKTEGTNRDFDETRESANQGHGHPREERGDRR